MLSRASNHANLHSTRQNFFYVGNIICTLARSWRLFLIALIVVALRLYLCELVRNKNISFVRYFIWTNMMMTLTTVTKRNESIKICRPKRSIQLAHWNDSVFCKSKTGIKVDRFTLDLFLTFQQQQFFFNRCPIGLDTDSVSSFFLRMVSCV